MESRDKDIDRSSSSQSQKDSGSEKDIENWNEPGRRDESGNMESERGRSGGNVDVESDMSESSSAERGSSRNLEH
jgi:hypothetical protein